MANLSATRLCSLNNCPREAVRTDTGRIGPWQVAIYYCYEHARELEAGTPLGPLGLDMARIDVHAAQEQPVAPQNFPGPA
jgi:hypothetical protein